MAFEVQSESAKITLDVIKKAIARQAKDRRIIVRDASTPGLALIVNAKSAAWVFAYRPRGLDPLTGARWPNKTVTLGNPASLSVDAARHSANAMKGRAAAGEDPHAARKIKLATAAADRASTATRMVADYEKALPRRPKLRGEGLPSASHVKDELAHLRAALATMEAQELPVSLIDAARLRRLLTVEAARPATARARFGAVSRFLDWAQDEGRLDVNPCLSVGRTRRPKPVKARAHYLTLEQLSLLWKSAERLDPIYCDLVRFLIALPCRRGEATHLDWLHLNLQEATWSQPGALTKNGEPHRLHLHASVLKLLLARHKNAGFPEAGLVFPAPRSKKAIDTFTDVKAELEKHAALAGWRWHDFRRSFASVLGELGLPEPVLDACLNHRQSATRGGVLGVYQRAQRWPEQASALRAWGKALDDAIRGKAAAGNVVRLKAKS